MHQYIITTLRIPRHEPRSISLPGPLLVDHLHVLATLFWLAVALFLLLTRVADGQPLTWESANGSRNPVAFIITRTDAILISGPSAGVLRSSDDGAHWFPSSGGMASCQVHCFAKDSAKNIYAGTADGAFRSTDDGNNWMALGSDLKSREVTWLGADMPGVLLALVSDTMLFRSLDDGGLWQRCVAPVQYFDAITSTRQGEVFIAEEGSIFRSLDSCKTWDEKAFGPGEFIQQFVSDQSGTVYAATMFQGILRSSNRGATWRQCGSNLSQESYAIAASPGGILVWYQNFSGVFFRSMDWGGTWTKSFPERDPWYVMQFGIDNHGRYVFTSAHTGFSRCEYDGTSYLQLRGGDLQAEHGMTEYNRLAIDPANTLYVHASLEGLRVSEDEGVTWWSRDSSRILSTEESLAAGETGELYAAAGMFFEHILRSTDGGSSWIALAPPAGVRFANAISVARDGTVFFGGGSSIYRSSDHGASWSQAAMPSIGSAVQAFNVRGAGMYYAGTKGAGVLRSSDAGANWMQCNTGFTRLDIRSIAVAANGTVYVGTGGSGVFRSTDQGDHWTTTSSTISNETVLSVGIAPGGILVAGTEFEGLWCSTDGGDSWVEANDGISEFGVWGLSAYQLLNDNSGRLYAMTDSGLFRAKATVTGIESPATPSLRCAVFPQPFTGKGTIDVELDRSSPLRVHVQDLLGRTVRMIDRTLLAPGKHRIPLDLGGLPSGNYFCRVHTRDGAKVLPVQLRR
jgi:photosystem II stability/assembly factor-like uncharacterized protein